MQPFILGQLVVESVEMAVTHSVDTFQLAYKEPIVMDLDSEVLVDELINVGVWVVHDCDSSDV